MVPPRNATSPWLVWIGFALAIAAMRLTRPVTMPLAFAAFVVMLFWPMQSWLRQRLPPGLALLVTLGAVGVTAAVFVGGVVWCVDAVAHDLPRYAERVAQLVDQASLRAQRAGLPFRTGGTLASRLEGAGAALGGTVTSLGHALEAIVLIAVFLVLAQGEADQFIDRVRRLDDPYARRILTIGEDIAHRFRRYVAVRTFTGAITGLLTWAFCAAMGLENAVVWGILTFLLYYVPTLGHIAAVVPPVVVALVQDPGAGKALATAGGLGLIQLVMGNYVDPKLQGSSLHISPLLVLFSVVFWAWVWGILGAVLGVPLTVALMVVLGRFDDTRWIAILLGGRPREPA